MAMDLHRPNPADQPAFFFHLGDVIYNHQYNFPESKANMYQPQFYVPYEHYAAKILAIPGNHDSNPQGTPTRLTHSRRISAPIRPNQMLPLPTCSTRRIALPCTSQAYITGWMLPSPRFSPCSQTAASMKALFETT